MCPKRSEPASRLSGRAGSASAPSFAPITRRRGPPIGHPGKARIPHTCSPAPHSAMTTFGIGRTRSSTRMPTGLEPSLWIVAKALVRQVVVSRTNAIVSSDCRSHPNAAIAVPHCRLGGSRLYRSCRRGGRSAASSVTQAPAPGAPIASFQLVRKQVSTARRGPPRSGRLPEPWPSVEMRACGDYESVAGRRCPLWWRRAHVGAAACRPEVPVGALRRVWEVVRVASR
jgi:hypothetical protein